MGVNYRHSRPKLGHSSASVSHKFDIRQRKFGKKWHVYDYTSNSTVFESPRKGACVKWIQNHKDLFNLASTHDWGIHETRPPPTPSLYLVMKRFCPTCQVMKPLLRWRLNKNTDGADWRRECMDCDNKRRSRRR